MRFDEAGGPREFVAQIAFVVVFSGVLILVTRNVVQWIRRGFKEPTKD